MADWQIGDLALCIASHPRYPVEVQPGSVHVVAYVWPGVADLDDPSNFDTAPDFVGVDRIPGDIAYWARNFIKIHPHTPDAEDAETIALLNGKPAVVEA